MSNEDYEEEDEFLEYPDVPEDYSPPENVEQEEWEDGDPNNPPPEVPDDFENIPFEDAQGLFDEGEEHTLTSDWGWRGLEDEDDNRYSDFHGGIDVDTSGRENIHVTGDGEVVHADDDTVIVDHGDGHLSTYEHLGSVDVTEGETVEGGDVIGTGSEGHLHYAEHDVGEDGTWQDRSDENAYEIQVSGETVREHHLPPPPPPPPPPPSGDGAGSGRS
ncbi:hypothetical protein ES703_97527 [subsurface metagenome]